MARTRRPYTVRRPLEAFGVHTFSVPRVTPVVGCCTGKVLVMDDFQTLYDEAKDGLQAVAGPLFDFAESQVSKRGAFLPFGATLDEKGEVQLRAAAGENDVTNSTEILLLLQDGLRQSRKPETRAVAICEWVKITPENGKQTDAIKVLVEHANGLAVAFYLPMGKKLLRGWQRGEMMAVRASPQIGAWASSPT